MIGRFLEAFFRHKLLVLLPVVAIPLIVGPLGYFMAPSYYEASASVWTERPAYLQTGSDSNSWTTPAQIQRDRLQELLQSRAFVLDVARRTPYGSQLGGRSGQDSVEYLIARNLGISVNGSHTLVIRFRGQTPQITVQVLNALLAAYQEKSAADEASQGEIAISFYQGQLKDAQNRLEKASDSLRQYIASNPRITMPDVVSGGGAVVVRPALSPALIDPKAADLMRTMESEQRNLESIKQSLDRAQLAVAVAQQGQELGFQVADAPQPPLAPTRDRKRVLVFPMAGLLLGLGLGAGLLVLLVAGDRSVRGETDLAGLARVVGSVPQLNVKPPRRLMGPDSTRRAIGFSARAALPPPGEAH
jgi:uncharacterized protein involved in exopolysaccharide biosynthesis